MMWSSSLINHRIIYLVHLDEISCLKKNVQLILPSKKTNTLQIKHEQLILWQNYLNFKMSRWRKINEKKKKKYYNKT